MKLSEDDYYRKLGQDAAGKDGSDAMGAGTNHTSPDWTSSIL